jgi:aliphatic nitrilase
MVGRIGQLACWEHYNPLARYAMMADGEQIHSAMYPGSIFMTGLPSRRKSPSGSMHWSLVLRRLRWRGWMPISGAMSRTPAATSARFGGCFTAIVAPDGSLLGKPSARAGVVIADLFTLIDRRKQLMDSAATTAAGIAQSPDRPHSTAHVHRRAEHPNPGAEQASEDPRATVA